MEHEGTSVFLRSCIAQFPSIISSFLQGFPSWYVGKEKWKSRLYLQVREESCEKSNPLINWNLENIVKSQACISTGTLKILWKVKHVFNWNFENIVKSQACISTGILKILWKVKHVFQLEPWKYCEKKNTPVQLKPFNSKAGVSPSPGLAVHSGTKHMVEAVADAVRQEVPQY